MCFKFLTQDIGIDLGTANTLIFCKGKGILLNEPSVVAMDERTKQILAVGAEAKAMIGRAPAHIRVVRPLRNGVISDFIMTQAMLKTFLEQVIQGGGMKTFRVVVGVPSGVTNVEKRAVEEVVRQMGAKDVYIMDEPMAAAIGVGLPVEQPNGYMVGDIGGGTADIAIISLGGIVNSVSLHNAGDEMDEDIINYLRKNFNLLIGNKTAEEIKVSVGVAIPDYEFETEGAGEINVKGRDILTGLPKTVLVRSSDIYSALSDQVGAIVDGVKGTLENAPPELAADIVVNGMVLAGGGALLKGLDTRIERETGLHVIVAENALEAVAEGTGRSLEQIGKVRRRFMDEYK